MPVVAGAKGWYRVLLLACLPVAACSKSPDQVFIVLMDADTVVVERVRRSADSLSGTIATRAPGAARIQRIQYAAALAPGMLVRELVVATPVDGAPRPQVTWVRMGRDSAGAFAATMQGTEPATARRFAVGQEAVPTISFSVGLLEQVVRRARNIPGDTVTVPIFVSDTRVPMRSTATFAGDSVHLVTGAERLMLRVDAGGGILGGGDPGRPLRIERVAVAPPGWLPD